LAPCDKNELNYKPNQGGEMYPFIVNLLRSLRTQRPIGSKFWH